ncbi:MAG: ArsC family reductase [Methylococcales symbiont of Hymedesmia sp. n. MRB-2018]|nr:MAG: ArsC family reductase [Methylococcales symbiont of Hymedesmia sp. n. MRB-2018]KAF3982974.1 MAG: ArsC family reductase [Methylococcales symbiont of Hymedesmia sp. n. MRB-2018]
MYTLYGISNCNTVKKAKDWLDDNTIDYQFHDYRKQGLTSELLESFESTLGWEKLLNKQSTSWRKLDEQQKANISKQTALQYMLDTPTLIKRPILDIGNKMIIGFKAENYQNEL